MKALKICAITGGIGAVLCAALAYFFWGKGGGVMAIGAGVIGLLLGLIAAPEFEPKAFKYAAWYQFLCGAIAGGLAGVWLSGSFATGLMAALIVGAVAWLAPWWLHRV